MKTYSNALIILNYNDAQTVMDLINKVKDYKILDKIVLVDNCSTDDSYDIFQRLNDNKNIDILRTEWNGGYAYGNNIGIRHAMEKYNAQVLFIANPDTSFEEKVLNQMQKCLMKDEKCAVVSGLVNQGYNVWDIPDYKGIINSLFLGAHNLYKRRIKMELIRSASAVEKVGVLEGSFLAIKAEIFKEIGGFDERTFLYEEENILAYKLRSYGYHECILTRARYDHAHSKSIKKVIGSKTRSFRYFYPSMKLYLKSYLNINFFQMIGFHICFVLAFFERIIYDIIKYLKGNRS